MCTMRSNQSSRGGAVSSWLVMLWWHLGVIRSKLVVVSIHVVLRLYKLVLTWIWRWLEKQFWSTSTYQLTAYYRDLHIYCLHKEGCLVYAYMRWR